MKSEGAAGTQLLEVANGERERVFDAFRRWGYLQANLDPLGQLKPESHPELDLTGEYVSEARAAYCGTVAAEFMHIANLEKRQWIQSRMESPALATDREFISKRLIQAEMFEQVLQQRYLGNKRFSLEGNTSLIPLLDEVLEAAGERGAEELVLGMSHRGRLTVLLTIAGRPAEELFVGFEDVDPRSVLGGGDVKYHLGATGDYTTRGGAHIHVHLVSNPSHLEAVDPVTIGRTRAKQDRAGKDGQQAYLPLLVHGDAAFAGQGVFAETLNLADLKGYSVGGTIHVIVNNLIGFTTAPGDEHSSRFASDLAKRQPVPVFHVNAEDVDAVVRIARIAAEYRYQFHSDVVVDLIGFRRHGHSEVDDPTITQPRLYKQIKEHPPLWKIYSHNVDEKTVEAQLQETRTYFEGAQKRTSSIKKKPLLRDLPKYWNRFCGGRYDDSYEVETALTRAELAGLGERLSSYPAGFNIHPKVKKLLEQRAEMALGKRDADYGMGEALAFASLLKQGIPVRLTGQDSRRGTFSHRHSALIDTETEENYMPLQHIAPDQARCEVYNSSLSESAVLGFEYGYSRDYPEALVLWEAQFGDFANVAQMVIDQFIAAGEEKWLLLSGLVMLLPHGHEGQGPEHSSARIERYLQLAARDNFQICQPSNAANYFHMLRRQALRKWRKPLIVFTPKSMLRNPDACSPLDEFVMHGFLPVVPDREAISAKRVLVCTGKIGHELEVERRKRKDSSTAIVYLDQLYPFPEIEMQTELDSHTSAREVVWVQEEPANMGAMFYVMPRLRRVSGSRPVFSVKRSASPSPATGSAKAHEMEQKTLLTLAFTSTGGTAGQD
jgi:2-oxoglutarate dehydrogenase E1 component